MTVTDALARQLRDLRISVTDRCNFRCVYCMPREVFGRDYEFLERAELLTFEEIERLARIFVGDHGVEKIRVTGGEPLVRREVERLVEMLARIPRLGDLAMTTNGSALARKARALGDAGLRRITVSLDNEVFAAVNDVGFPVERVLAGIEAAAAAGLGRIKLNMVVKRGVNEDSVVPMARHFRGSGHLVRFIEYMDVGRSNGWRMDEVVPAAEIVAMIGAEMPLEPVGPNYLGEVVERWRYGDGSREIGVIASVTAVLRRLRARPAVRRGEAVHLPVRCSRPRPARVAARRCLRCGDLRGDRRDLVDAGGPLLGASRGRDSRPAEGGDVLHRRVGHLAVALAAATSSRPRSRGSCRCDGRSRRPRS